jgi:GntR family transcriptional repressor for pyruvate dehydrogenase complex
MAEVKPPHSPVPHFGPVKTRRIFEEICDQIRRELASGALKPGDKLPAERELAVQFGAGRTAVREALRSLEIAGVVGLQKGVKGGAFILQGSPGTLTQSIQDMLFLGRITLDSLTEARLLIQDVVVRLACERATEADIAAIEANIDVLEALTRAGRFDDRVVHSVAFYGLLARATQNEVLVIMVDALTEILRHFVARAGPLSKLDLIESRRRFLPYFKARDADKAAQEISSHLRKLHRHLMDHEAGGAARAPLTVSA